MISFVCSRENNPIGLATPASEASNVDAEYKTKTGTLEKN
jgi:hypothetical protein